ncbi:pyridoxamine 5'-phosphate oxidase family protein [Megalodesulfovibrio paquesii]
MQDVWPHNSLTIMRRKEKQMNEPEAIQALLQQAQVLQLGMCEDGWPYVTPVNFALLDGAICIHSARKGRKFEILQRNPRVCITVTTDATLTEPAHPENACQYSMRFRSVIGFGTAVIHTDLPMIRRGLEALMARYSTRKFTFPETVLEKTALIRITPEVLTGKQDGWA